MSERLLVTTRAAWRQWLEKNHTASKEIWLIYFKKHTGEPRIPYDDAVEEAICFGWIDSIVKRIDVDRYMQKFTPRTNTANWSALNVLRAKKMAAAGKMTAAGLEKISPEMSRGGTASSSPPVRMEPAMPEELERALASRPLARKNFDRLAPSHKRNYCGWIGSAKRAETREKRIREAVQLLEKNQKLGLK